MTLEEIQDRLVAIKAQCFIKSLRKHSTGIGKTLETLLGITENNIPLPDLGEIELKAIRRNSKNMITLFTFNKKVWKMDPLDAIKKYGKKDKNGETGHILYDDG
ncbi:MvaI/BcnI family restriction endonuclease [Candidatus Azobacteroides pseudotrichonymphae]|uniref:MvaI/BcnI family restriction endonuclease n=1 Tax=Candidatus Azobacteroides pseudotrichonymphae TaxID=511435 RepID=UPI0002EDB5E5|nr:MvaI/BcnI family restriction endonuclease [Candidatus Azobacteroides pseudotrichonymphae]